ncbi:hypothetical protein ACTXJ5_03100 [Psychrobacter alimentarius]|uniref:hypothetical protein n=1 Tax=Psychrobacter alimentarius TaxID=261164 RepID=UPI003FD3D8A2
MKNATIFEDSSLQSIQFINFGKDLLVKFDSSYNGSYIGSLLCRNIILLKYSDLAREYTSNNESKIDEGFFSSYIACINIDKVDDYYKIEFEPIVENITIHCLEYEVIQS